MDNNRSKTKGKLVEITDENSLSHKISYVLFGSIGTVFGILIYFVMPLAILSFDISLLLMIFFLILVGMMFGITLISLNLQ